MERNASNENDNQEHQKKGSEYHFLNTWKVPEN